MPTARCASRAAPTAGPWCTRRSRSARCAGAGRRPRPRSPAGPPWSGTPSTSTSGTPTFPPPYVIAVVALAEDPSVRLTTNIVGCDVGDVAHRARGPGPLRASRATSGSLSSSRPGRTSTVEPDVTPKLPAPRAADRRRAVRAPRRAQSGVGPVGPRAPADGRPPLPDRRRLPGGGGRRRSGAVGHRRAVHLPGCGRDGDERGRGGRRRGGAPPPSDLDQRRRRHPRARGGADRRHAGHRRRAVPARPVLPNGVGVDLRHPRPPTGRRRTAPRGLTSGGRPSVPCPPPTGSP